MNNEAVAKLKAQFEEQQPGKCDDRFVGICAKLAAAGLAMREEIFLAIEQDDFETAFGISDEMVKVDRCYMLSLKHGMDLVKKAREEKEKDPESDEAKAKIVRDAEILRLEKDALERAAKEREALAKVSAKN